MELIGSSDPHAVDDHRARSLLTKRVVLTTAVCRELQRVDERNRYRRAEAAYSLLLDWIDAHFEVSGDTRPDDGMEDMVISEGTAHLVDELWDGISVCQAFAMLRTADSRGDYERDAERIRERLEHFPY